MSYESSDAEKLNAISLMKSQLELEIRDKIYTDICNEYIAKFTEEIQPKVLAEVQKLTFESIESFHDYMNIRNELRILISVAGVEVDKTIRNSFHEN